MPDYAAQRLNMVESQVRPADVTDLAIQAAMRDLPRERFVPAAKRGLAYMDGSIEVAHGRYLLEPRTLAKLLQAAEIKPTDKVLDVACTAGYSTAVLARLTPNVIGLEQDADLVRIAIETLAATGAKAEIAQGALADGLPKRGPFDVIFINGGIETAPQKLLQQLAEDGRLLCVMREGAAGYARIYVRHDGAVGARDLFDAYPPVLPGFREPAGFVF